MVALCQLVEYFSVHSQITSFSVFFARTFSVRFLQVLYVGFIVSSSGLLH